MFFIHPLLPSKVVLRDCAASWTIMQQMISWDLMGHFTRALCSLQNHVRTASSNLFIYLFISISSSSSSSSSSFSFK